MDNDMKLFFLVNNRNGQVTAQISSALDAYRIFPHYKRKNFFIFKTTPKMSYNSSIISAFE